MKTTTIAISAGVAGLVAGGVLPGRRLLRQRGDTSRLVRAAAREIGTRNDEIIDLRLALNEAELTVARQRGTHPVFHDAPRRPYRLVPLPGRPS